MKIEKGYTLSQFVDLMKNKQDKFDVAQDIDSFNVQRLGFIIRYNNFLKQPLNKEMFVNEHEMPCDRLFGENPVKYRYERLAHTDGEKKVIFKGWEKSMYHNNIVINGMTELVFSSDNHISFKCGYHGSVKTIGDLFQATNGELELQNIEI